MGLLLLIVVLLLLFGGGGGYHGYSRGSYGGGGYGLIRPLVIIIILFPLFGHAHFGHFGGRFQLDPPQ